MASARQFVMLPERSSRMVTWGVCVMSFSFPDRAHGLDAKPPGRTGWRRTKISRPHSSCCGVKWAIFVGSQEEPRRCWGAGIKPAREDAGELLRNAAALLFPIDWPEPFGL